MYTVVHRSASSARDWNQQSRVAYVIVVMATDDNFWISGKYFWIFEIFHNVQNMSLEFWLIFAEFCISIIRKK